MARVRDGWLRDSWLLVFLLLWFGTACEDPPPPPGDGAFILGIKTIVPPGSPVLSGGMHETLTGLSGIRATVTRVDVVHRTSAGDPSTERLLTVDSTTHTIDLAGNLHDEANRQLGFFTIPPGFVFQIRFQLQNTEITLRGETHPVKVPSTVLKIEPLDGTPFEIIADRRTSAQVQFDPFFSLVRNAGIGFHLKPVMQAIPVAVRDLSTIVLDRVIVKFRASVTEMRIDQMITARRMGVIARWRLNNYYVLSLPTSTSLIDALDDFHDEPEVEVVVPDVLMESGVTTPNDTVWSSQTQFTQVNFDDAWDTGTGTFEPIVAVVDTGIDLDNRDLIANMFINRGEIPARVMALVTDSNIDGSVDWRDIDFNGDNDGVLTFGDLDSATNVGLGLCPRANNAPAMQCDPLDLVDGSRSTTYGWQDGLDNDNPDGRSTFVDDVVGWNFQSNTNLPVESSGAGTSGAHGTEVAGVAGAVGNNSTDVAGASWRVRILPVRIDTSLRGKRFSTIKSSSILGINYAALMGADIINLSSGFYMQTGSTTPSSCGTSAIVSSLSTDKFNQLRTEHQNEMTSSVNLRTSVLVPIAHNCPFNIDSGNVFEWPSSFKNNQFLVVASVDGSGNMSTFSARGTTTIDIAAPGENYQMLMPGNGNTNNCRGTVGDCDGTSYAAPLVAGATALVLSLNLATLRGRPCRLIDRVLRNAATIAGPRNSIAGDRLLDADRAVDNAVTMPVRTCP